MIKEILQKLGIRSIDNLKQDERATYMQWFAVLARDDVTIDDLKKLLPAELDPRSWNKCSTTNVSVWRRN